MGKQLKDLIVRRAFKAEFGEPDAEGRFVDVIASTDTVDLAGEVMQQDFDLARYEKNPVVLYFHNLYARSAQETLPIGHASDVRVEEGKLKARLHFVDAKAQPLAENVWQSFVQKSVRAVSIGARPKKVVAIEIEGRTVLQLTQNELLEISVCPVPINPDSVAEETKALKALMGDEPTEQSPAPPAPTQETKHMKSIAKFCSLPETADEAEILTALTSQKSFHQKNAQDLERIAGELGVKSGAEAFGAVVGLKEKAAKADKLEAEAKKAEADRIAVEKAALIKSAMNEGKLVPAQQAWAESQSLEALKGYVSTAPVHAAFKGSANGTGTDGKEQQPAGTGEKYEELSFPARAALKAQDPAKWEAMREDAIARGALPGVTA